jgi:hypothetical protein
LEVQEGLDDCGCARAGEEVALDVGAAEVAQALELLLGLDALR